jgi:uncharacterized protein (DUF58 family)
MLRALASIYPNRRLWHLIGLLVALYALGYFVPAFYPIARVLTLAFFVILFADVGLLVVSGKAITGSRQLPMRLSISDQNDISLQFSSNYGFPLNLTVLEELPPEFGQSGLKFELAMRPYSTAARTYQLKPLRRGILTFGVTNVYASTRIGVVARRFRIGQQQEVKVYPSFLQMRRFEIMAISNRLTEVGVKPVRRRGTQIEFDSIAQYVPGDDFRHINWKATSRREELMVNRYQDERTQSVYCVIDMGRTMKMPFGGMSLLDYAINSSLVLANTALLKGDKAGLITFDSQIGVALPADRRPGHINRFLETLYNLRTSFMEPNYEALYPFVHRRVAQRSMLVLFSNFETLYAMQSKRSVLLSIARRHLLLVVLFENTELLGLTSGTARSIKDVYVETAAEKLVFEKRLIARELNNLGVLTLLTRPADLSVGIINKYLEVKASRMI